jgi:hypothetical protein
MSKQRVFSHESDLNYRDYIQRKNGNQILQNIKHENKYFNYIRHNKPYNINYFPNHNEYLTLAKSYFNELNTDKCHHEALTNMYNSNIATVKKEEEEKEIEKKIEKETKKHCTPCTNPDILYPYAYYRQLSKCGFMYPYKIDVDLWCKNKKQCLTYPPQTYDVCAPQSQNDRYHSKLFIQYK